MNRPHSFNCIDIMGKAALLAIAAFVISATYYNAASRDGTAATARTTSEHQLTVLARNAALAGYDQGRQAVADAGMVLPFVGPGVTVKGDYDDASYRASITSDGSVATIESVGTIRGGADDVTFSIHAVIGYEIPPATDVPLFMTYALLTEQSLVLNGNVSGYVDDAASMHNANFHSNGNLLVNGSAADVAGFGTYVGAGTGNPPSALASTFQPHHNPDELETAYRAAYVDMPLFDADEFLAGVIVDETSAGDIQLTGSIDLGGTREDPYVWHVRGDLTSAGNTSVSGYVMFVVEGDITLGGDLIAGDAEGESTIALYGSDVVTLSGNAEIHGQIYAGGDVIFNGTPDIYGSVASRSLAILNGHPGIHYRPASSALTTIFPREEELRLLSYYEH